MFCVVGILRWGGWGYQGKLAMNIDILIMIILLRLGVSNAIATYISTSIEPTDSTVSTMESMGIIRK